MSLTWREALKKFNDERSANGGGKYTIPKKGTPEYEKVKALQNAPLEKNILANKPERSASKTPPKDKKSMEVLTAEQAEATMGQKKKTKETSIADIPVETEAAPKPKAKAKKLPVDAEAEPKSKSKVKVFKPEAANPPGSTETATIKFD